MIITLDTDESQEFEMFIANLGFYSDLADQSMDKFFNRELDVKSSELQLARGLNALILALSECSDEFAQMLQDESDKREEQEAQP